MVTEKAAEVGEIVAPISIGGSMARGSIVTVADWASLQAEVDVAEAQLGRVKAQGCAVSLAFHGMKTGMMNWATFSETAFEFLVTPQILATSSLIALAMGFVGGVLPAFRAARMKVVDALRRA